MKAIALSRDKIAWVDDEDYANVSRFKWYAHNANDGKWYARRDVVIDGKKLRVYMHREIMSAGIDVEVDHANGDGLFNCRSNLRVATKTQNRQNSKRRKDSRHGFKGVNVHGNTPRIKKYQAVIVVNGKRISRGYYATLEQAARAYDAAALEHFGQFARLNFPSEQGGLQ